MEKDFLNVLASNQNQYLVPPYVNKTDKEFLIETWKSFNLNDHVFILSSGTTNSGLFKSYALSKNSLKNNACAVNRFLNAKSEDKWLCALPFYHVGGLSIYVRAMLLNQEVINFHQKWDPSDFIKKCQQNSVQFTSLVPTQLYDLVQLKWDCPSSFKGIFIGGDFLNQRLENEALKLNIPIIKTYGMTELCSQVATGHGLKIEDNFLKVLDIHKVDIQNQRVYSKSPYTAEILIKEDQAIEANFYNESYGFDLPDKLEFKTIDQDVYLRPLGRKGSEIKIKGRLFNFLEIRDIIEKELYTLGLYQFCAIKIVDDLRDGNKIKILVHRKVKAKQDEIVSRLSQVLPFHFSFENLELVDRLERTELGKLKAD